MAGPYQKISQGTPGAMTTTIPGGSSSAASGLPSGGSKKSGTGMNFMKLAAGIGGVGALAEAGMGIYQLINAQRLANEFEPVSQLTYKEIQDPVRQNISMQEKRAQQGLSYQTEELIKRRQANVQAGSFRRASELGQSGAALSAIAGMDQYKMATELGFAEEQEKVRGESQLAASRAQLTGLLGQQKREEDAQDAAYLNEISRLRYQGIQNVTGAITGASKIASNLAYVNALTKSGNIGTLPKKQ